MNEKEFCGSYEPGPRKRKGKKIMKKLLLYWMRF